MRPVLITIAALIGISTTGGMAVSVTKDPLALLVAPFVAWLRDGRGDTFSVSGGAIGMPETMRHPGDSRRPV